ncbi:hypothetical protein [Novosphingobium sp.]|uniref:hypothetical protein n=1 Tax=Novosphingobium sp. TaxID=1874826 RepID=UPI0025FBA7F2|nr:hypothetical protein [Novosphingobium sp.]
MTPEKRTAIYLNMAHMGFFASLGFAAANALHWPDFVKGLTVGLLLLPLVIAPLRRMRDEYIDSLWRAGTAWAFVAVIASFLFAPFLEGFYDGLAAAPSHQNIPVEAAGYAAILAFFIGFHVEWLRARL